MNAQMQQMVKTSPGSSVIPVQAGQRKKSGEHEPSYVPPVVHEVLNSPGEPLDNETRAFMEPRFGHDFSKVRVHTDARAAESARAVNALAYTRGNNIAFGNRQYAPEKNEGRQLLAHELTHVIQQEREYIKPPQSNAGASILRDKSLEHDADMLSARMIQLGITGGSFYKSNINQVASMQKGIIQLKEMPNVPPAKDDKEGTEQGVDEDGKFCIRLWIPGIESLKGKVKWQGIDQKTLNENVRLKPEVGTVLKRATANETDTLDAIYFGANLGRRVFKVPDYCTSMISNNLNNISCCCNLAGRRFDKLRDHIPGCRWVTPDEFSIPNNWENL